MKETEMFLHPDLLLTQFHDRQKELIAEADRHRLLAAMRRHRPAADGGQATRNRLDGTLAGCGSREAAPAR